MLQIILHFFFYNPLMRKYHQCKHHQSRCNVKPKEIGDVFCSYPLERGLTRSTILSKRFCHILAIMAKYFTKKPCFPLQWVGYFPLLFIQNFRMLLIAFSQETRYLLFYQIKETNVALFYCVAQSKTLSVFYCSYIISCTFIGESTVFAVCSSTHLFKMFHTARQANYSITQQTVTVNSSQISHKLTFVHANSWK